MEYNIYRIKPNFFKIIFNFELSDAIVTVESVGENEVLLTSLTDGYHWFEFWLAQDPGSPFLFAEDAPNKFHTEKVKKLWNFHNFIFRPEDKETFYLNFGLGRKFDSNLMNEFVKIIGPRFEQRDKFFPPNK